MWEEKHQLGAFFRSFFHLFFFFFHQFFQFSVFVFCCSQQLPTDDGASSVKPADVFSSVCLAAAFWHQRGVPHRHVPEPRHRHLLASRLHHAHELRPPRPLTHRHDSSADYFTECGAEEPQPWGEPTYWSTAAVPWVLAAHQWPDSGQQFVRRFVRFCPILLFLGLVLMVRTSQGGKSSQPYDNTFFIRHICPMCQEPSPHRWAA